MSRAVGEIFEKKACQLIQKAGYEIVATNYTAAGVGEIDIIAYGEDTLVAIEVKARSSKAFGTAVQMVTPAKQKKIANTMLYFLQDEKYQQYANSYVRFDVIGFDDDPLWIQGAFLMVE